MASPGWFDMNRSRAFPFVARTVGLSGGPLTVGNLPTDCIVDAGFIAGPLSGYESDGHSVVLKEVRRAGSFLYFDFVGTAPGLAGVTLTFARSITAGRYVQEFVESDGITFSGTDSLSDEDCEEPLLSGFLVTGDLEALLQLLPSDGSIGDNDDYQYGQVEPACTQSLAGSYVTGVAVANADRTHAQAADGCEQISYPFEDDTIFVREVCLSGDVVFQAGFNAEVQQDSAATRLTLRAVVGGGAGEPCEEITLYDSEEPLEGSILLTGGPSCPELLRSVNGSGGPRINLKAGLGVVIQPDPENNTVIVNADFTGMAGCYSADSVSDTEIIAVE